MTTKRYRILDYFWHAAHGTRLLRVPADWSYFVFGDRQRWNYNYRPLGDNLVNWVTRYESGAYDAAILHIDQWSVDSRFSLRSFPYHFLNSQITDIPKIVIMHGLPEGERNRMRLWQMIGKNYLVTNTEWSRRMMGLSESRSRAIVPGYDVDDWGPCRFERREIVVTVAGSHTARDHHGMSIINRLKADGLPVTWIGQDVRFSSYADYREYLSGASVYLNPCQWSQHPGARNEAMLTGLPIVSTNYTDETEYIRNGIDGYLSNDYAATRDWLLHLLDNPGQARRMGESAREHARELFDHRRYVAEWLAFIGDVVS